MFGGKWSGIKLALAGAAALMSTRSLRADIDLAWRPNVLGASVDDIVEVGFYAVSDTGFEQTFSGIDAIVRWDPSQLTLLDFVEPCTLDPCPVGTYNWIQSWFPDDSQLDGINNDLTDGDVLFQVLGQLGVDSLPIATLAGLHVTTLRFRVLALGATEIALDEQIGMTRTRVAGGDLPGIEVTGTLGPPVQVISRTCEPPAVEASGCRYVTVTPEPGDDAVALLVEGDLNDASISCVTLFVQPDGSVAEQAVYQMPDEWGTVHVTGEEIRPLSSYSVRSDCSEESTGLIVSDAADATTWRWGDTNGDGLVGFTDVSRVIDSSDGELPPGVLLDAVDLFPCAPDGVVSQADVDEAVDALGLRPYPCAPTCVTMTLDDLMLFADCLAGPFVAVDESCMTYDFDQDGDVDAWDFWTFQRRFVGGGN